MVRVMLRKIEEFQPFSRLIQCLRNPGLKSYHWEMISERIGVKVFLTANRNLTHYMELGLQNHLDEISRVAEIAGKEYSIEQDLENMEKEWATDAFDSLFHNDAETGIPKIPQEIFQLLDDHIAKTHKLSLSPVKKVFEGRLSGWERKLRLTQEVLGVWLSCQRAWITMEPFFRRDDVRQQLDQGRTYQHLELHWTDIMIIVSSDQNVIELCQNAQLLSRLKHYKVFLEKTQEALTEYLEKK